MTETFRCAKRWMQRAGVLLIAVTLAGCFDQQSDEGTSELMPPVSSASTDPGPPPVENSPPDISGVPPASVVAGELYSFTPKASDADQDFLEFSISNKPSWAEFSTDSGALNGMPPDDAEGETADITITVTDGRDTRAVGPFRIRIHPRTQPPSGSNTAPTISGTPPGSVVVGQNYSFRPSAADTDGDALSFSISNRPSWASFSTTTGQLSGAPGEANVATYSNIVISVSDGQATTSLPAFAIQVQGPQNQAPTIGGTPATSVQAAQAYSFQPEASDADGDPLTFAITNRPSWASFSTTTGRLSGTPSTSHVGTYSNIVISTSDGRLSAALPAFSISVTAAPNEAPTISGTPPTAAVAGSGYSFEPTASDPDDDSLGFSIQNRPSWASFDTSTGRLSGTPTTANVGTFGNIVISVSDGRASASLAAFSITVTAPANGAPSISGTPGTSVTAGTAYSFQPSASDPNGDTLTFSISNRPSWATFNTGTGRLSGTPTSTHAGTYSNIVISVSDGTASASLPAFSIAVTQPTVGSATLSWMPPTQNTDGTALSDLAGYRIVYGTSAGALNQMIQVSNPSVTTYVIDDLTPATWYFAVKAYNSAGVDSDVSNVASKTIQ